MEYVYIAEEKKPNCPIELPTRQSEAVSIETIQARIGASNKRAALQAVRDWRRAGIPVMTDKASGGYWVSEDPHDIRMWARQSKSAAFDILKTAETLLSVADSIENNQITMTEIS